MVAKLKIEAGYYHGAQVVVETDPHEIIDVGGWYGWETQAELLEQYTPHNKRLFKAIKKATTPLKIKAQFSNGETIYSTT